jgi:hypothetical protein
MLSPKVGHGKDRLPALPAFVDRAIQPAWAFLLEGKIAARSVFGEAVDVPVDLLGLLAALWGESQQVAVLLNITLGQGSCDDLSHAFVRPVQVPVEVRNGCFGRFGGGALMLVEVNEE